MSNLGIAFGPRDRPCHVPPLVAAVSGVGRGNDGGRLIGVISVAGMLNHSSTTFTLKRKSTSKIYVLLTETLTTYQYVLGDSGGLKARSG